MTNQAIVDEVDYVLSGKVPARVLEKILDHVWEILNDELDIDIEDSE